MSGKCDELKDKWFNAYPEIMGIEGDYPTQCYGKADVDAAIDELKTEHHKERHEYIEMVAQLRRENAELKAELEDAKATAYADSVDADMENRRLKRALWLARAERAVAEQTVDEWSRYKEKHPFGLWRVDTFEYWVQAWIYVEKLCRKKAEEYK